ncbi:glycosyltransferase [Microtetraspora fusca]|uniref:glycosyltransferase n=1 Tax=Microtetraspora fusca TaxID=1997 RepID=UPI000ABF78AE|nr:glycosyltransferase [Microtetraspora fusca]
MTAPGRDGASGSGLGATSVPDVTVVVPVRDTARWLPEALASLDAQRCRDRIEVVVVDDGSTDGSGEIAEAYARDRPSVRLVRQENAGLGAARNRGTDLASGRYLAFLDSDDLYAEGGLDALLAAAERHDADVVIGDMLGMPPRPSPAWRRELVVGERVIGSVAEAPDIVGNPSACNKIFRRELVTAAGARFSEGTAFEDVLFTLPLLLRARRVVLTDRPCYRYRTRDDGSSIMDSRGRPERIMQHLAVVERLVGGLADQPPAVRRAVARWAGHMQLHYTRRAASALGDAELAAFAHRMSILLKEIAPEVLAEFVTGLGGGLRAVGAYRGDPELIKRPVSSASLRVLSGRVYLDVPELDRFGDLLMARPLSAVISRIGAAGEGALIRVEGHVNCPGLLAAAGEERPDLLLELGDAVLRRRIRVTRAKPGRFAWSCHFAGDDLPPGDSVLRLIVRDRFGAETALPLTVAEHATASVRLSVTTGRGTVLRRLGGAVRRRARVG